MTTNKLKLYWCTAIWTQLQLPITALRTSFKMLITFIITASAMMQTCVHLVLGNASCGWVLRIAASAIQYAPVSCGLHSPVVQHHTDVMWFKAKLRDIAALVGPLLYLNCRLQSVFDSTDQIFCKLTSPGHRHSNELPLVATVPENQAQADDLSAALHPAI
jgi:hypothetical protein